LAKAIKLVNLYFGKSGSCRSTHGISKGIDGSKYHWFGMPIRKDPPNYACTNSIIHCSVPCNDPDGKNSRTSNGIG